MARRSFIYAGLGLAIAANLSPLAAQEPILRITKADCASLVEAAKAVGITYQPGIDVRGRSVVAADLAGGTALEMPGQVLIRIGVELAERLGIPRGPSNFDADAEVGVVEVREQHAYFNGQRLHGEAEAELAAKCRGRLLETVNLEQPRADSVVSPDGYERDLPVGQRLPLDFAAAQIEVDNSTVYRSSWWSDADIDIAHVRRALTGYLVVGKDEWLHGYGHVWGGDQAGWLAMKDGTRLQWMLRPGGLGMLVYPDGGYVLLAACRSELSKSWSGDSSPDC